MLISWAASLPGDVDRLRDALDPDTVVLGLTKGRGGEVLIHGSCLRIAQVLPNLNCDAADPHELPVEALSSLRTLVGRFFTPDATLSLSGEAPDDARAALVLSRESQRSLEQRSSAAAFPRLPVASVSRTPGRSHQAPLQRWLEAGTVVAASTLVLAVALLAVNGVIEWRQAMRSFLAMGVRREQLKRFQGAQYALPFAVHAGFGIAASTFGCWYALRLIGASMPWHHVSLIAAVLFGVGLVGAGLAYTLAPALQLRDPRD